MSKPSQLSLPITGMTCSACAARIEKVLNRLDGLDTATVNFASEQANVVFDAKQISTADITAAIDKAGFSTPTQQFSFAVEGMTCSACATRIERTLKRIPGITGVSVNLALERGEVTAAGSHIDQSFIESAVDKTGFKAVFDGQEEHTQDNGQTAPLAGAQRALIASTLLTAPLVLQMFAMMTGSGFHLPPAAELLLATPVQFLIGARFYKAAWKAIKAGSGNMDVLVAMGTTTAYLYSLWLLITLGPAATGQLYFEASAVIITLVLLGKYMEARAKLGTTEAIRKLMDLRPVTASIIRNGEELQLPVAKIVVGDICIIRPGESIPVDGTIESGNTQVDESLITGESLPVDKSSGDTVTGGAINGSGLIRVSTTAVGEDSTLNKIIHLVQNAQAGKAPIQRLVDRISAVFVPVVLGIAVLTFAGWFFSGGTLEQALIAAVSVMVIACPCALGLATPTAIMTGTGAAAKAGILIKNVETLERAHSLDTIVFDKTGTLTTGSPTVVDVHTCDDDERELLLALASLQQGSEHPLAKAVLCKAEQLDIELEPVSEFNAHVGHGVSGKVGNDSVISGNRSFMDEHKLITRSCDDLEHMSRAKQWESGGKTVIWVAKNDHIVGLLAIADPLRAQSTAAVRSLHSMGISTILLSGDAPLVAKAVGTEAGVENISGGMKPDDKAHAITELQSDGKRVGMIGDGINDAPALATADVGIAMGSGTDVAMETAGITLMRSDPLLVPGAISVSRATWSKIKQNLFWAFIYNLVGIPFAAFGLLNPTIAGAAMALSSVSVVSNSLLLRRWRPITNPSSENKKESE